MPTPTPFDWTPIFGIEFRFSSASNPTAATSLNKAYSEIIGKDELSDFFVTCDAKEDKGPLEIAPDPQLHILNCIAKTIAINLIDPDEVTKGHIANLLSKCVIKHVTNNGGPTKPMRYTTEFDAAAKHAIHTNTDEEPTVLIELTITHWRFKPNWNASLFNKIYEDQSVIIPSSPATIPSNTSKDNVLPSSSRDLFMQAYTGDTPSTTAKLLPVRTTDSIVDTPAPNSNAITPSLVPAQPAEANVNVIVPSDYTGIVHTKTTPLSSTAPNTPSYTWTWKYSPNNDSVSFRRVRSTSVSFRRTASSSPPVQRQDESAVTPVQRRDNESIVTALPATPSTLPSSDPHPVPLYEPTDFRWTFNPQSESVVFHRLPKPAPVPLQPSLQLPLLKAIPEVTILASAIPTFEQHGAYPSHFCCAIYSTPIQTVFCITKRHRDALKIKMYHLYATILSMNLFYDTID
eukprot:jgi/Psemu1/60171/gm1.60171_g